MTFLSPLQISIHALREEGDSPAFCGEGSALVFLSTPSARRATSEIAKSNISVLFLSTPSARRATLLGRDRRVHDSISIHALREEGDLHRYAPHRGGGGFLSTPSARRATAPTVACALRPADFYPRPPRGGRQWDCYWFSCFLRDFYPRPPRGGRQQKQRQNLYFQTNYTTFCTNLEEP